VHGEAGRHGKMVGSGPSIGPPRTDVEAPMDEQITGSEAPVLDDATRAKRLADLQALIDLMRPAVQADGGDLVLVNANVDTGVVEVELAGACSSCAVSSATLQGGVERIMVDRLDWVTEVIGGVDDSMDDFESASMGRGGYVPKI
jgi:Fe-S cluster biogenesis protein NfuA